MPHHKPVLLVLILSHTNPILILTGWVLIARGSHARLLLDAVPHTQDRLNWKSTAHGNPFPARQRTAPIWLDKRQVRAATWYQLCETKKQTLPRAAAARNRYPAYKLTFSSGSFLILSLNLLICIPIGFLPWGVSSKISMCTLSVRTTNYEAFYYAVFSVFGLLPTTSIQIFFLELCSQTS
jgi:hypothetical protein